MKKHDKKVPTKEVARKAIRTRLLEKALYPPEIDGKLDSIRVFPTQTAESRIWEACLDT